LYPIVIAGVFWLAGWILSLATFARGNGKECLAALLPAGSVSVWQIFALYPIRTISDDMPFDALGIHNVFVEVGIIRADPGGSNFWDEIFTPRHGYVPSLRSISGPTLSSVAQDGISFRVVLNAQGFASLLYSISADFARMAGHGNRFLSRTLPSL